MAQAKKILVLVGGSYISGAEKVTLDVLKGMKKNGHQLHCIVSGWNDGDFIERLNILNIPYSTIKLGWLYTSNLRWTMDSLVHYPKGVFDFLRIKKFFKPDIVYTASFRQVVLLYPFFTRNILYHVHDPNSNSRQSRFFMKKIAAKVAAYIAVSESIKKDLLQCGLDMHKITVVYNGIDILPLPGTVTNAVFSIGIVGQIIQRKGHTVLVDALKLLHDQNMQIKLVVVGKGDEAYEQLLRNKIQTYQLEQWVEWRGFLKDLTKIYEGIDVVMAPTQNEEPFGLMACEANMFGKPAIVSNKGGLPEIIVDNMNGYVIDNISDPKAFANAIMQLYNNRNLVGEMGKKGRQRVIDHFSVDQMNHSIQALIEQL